MNNLNEELHAFGAHGNCHTDIDVLCDDIFAFDFRVDHNFLPGSLCHRKKKVPCDRWHRFPLFSLSLSLVSYSHEFKIISARLPFFGKSSYIHGPFYATPIIILFLCSFRIPYFNALIVCLCLCVCKCVYYMCRLPSSSYSIWCYSDIHTMHS